MKYLVVCNTGSDSLSRISLDFASVTEFKIDFNGEKLGPSGICKDNNNVYIANNYNDTVSIININSFREENRIYVGSHPNDLICYKNYLYIACSGANLISVYNIKEERIEFDIKTNSWPYNMEVYEEKNIILTSNFESNSISIIDTITNKVIEEINTLDYPTKIKLSMDKKHIYVCESYMGGNKDGFIEIINSKSYISEYRIRVGKTPMDIEEDANNIYVTNFEDGSLSIIDKASLKESKRILVGGMPKAIKKYKDYFIISDYFNSRLVIINFNNGTKKAITVGKEPNAMTIY